MPHLIPCEPKRTETRTLHKLADTVGARRRVLGSDFL